MGLNNFFRLEKGRFLDKRKLIVLILFYLLSIYFIQSGIGQYKAGHDEIKRFQEFEKTRIDNFQYYDQYGTYGFRLLYVPGPLSALFSGAGIVTNNLNAFIDAGERMKIYEPFKGKNAFIGYTSIFLNMTGFLLLIGSILALFYGWEAYKDKEFLKLLVNIIGSRKRIFWSILFVRLVFLVACCVMMALIAWLLFIVNGFGSFAVGNFIIYILVAFLMLSFFLLVGMVAGALKTKLAGVVAIFVAWLLFVFMLPAVMGKIVYSRSKSLVSAYEMDIDKFRLFMDIERKAKEQAGQMKRDNTKTEIRQQLYEYFWNNEFKQIFDHEQAMINEMKGVIAFHHDISLIFPTSFFLSVNNEISGRGYKNLMSFYEYVLKHKKGFIQYYAEKSFYSGEKKVKPYLKSNGNTFYTSSLLPDSFGFGLAVSIMWLVGLLSLSWIYFNRLLDQSPETENDHVKDPKPKDIRKNKITLVVTPNPWRRWQLLLTLKTDKAAFLPVPGPDCLPGDLTAAMILSLFSLPVPDELQPVAAKYCYRLSMDHKALIILEIIKTVPADVLIFDDFLVVGISEEFRELFKKYLHDNRIGRRVAYFSNSLAAAHVCTDSINYKSESPLPVP